MDEGRGPAWLSSYYERTLSECTTSFRRRDNDTNWSCVMMAAVVGTYFVNPRKLIGVGAIDRALVHPPRWPRTDPFPTALRYFGGCPCMRQA